MSQYLLHEKDHLIILNLFDEIILLNVLSITLIEKFRHNINKT